MRIVDRATFLAMPAGTLYAKSPVRWAFNPPCVKGDTLGNDWVCVDLTRIEMADSGEWLDRLDAMADRGASFPLDLDSGGRDGMFEPDALFLVYELDDLCALAVVVAKALHAAGAT